MKKIYITTVFLLLLVSCSTNIEQKEVNNQVENKEVKNLNQKEVLLSSPIGGGFTGDTNNDDTFTTN